MLSLIVAVSKNHVIGYENKMPWHLPAELAYFQRITTGHPIIMGRKTFQSIGRPLPNRRNIVVSRNMTFTAEGIEVSASLEDALALCEADNPFVIGGATLYVEALGAADRLYLTEIDADLKGDTFFPSIDDSMWEQQSREVRLKDEKNIFDLAFLVFNRRKMRSK
jgi:dihydrofolate reductase